MKQWVIHAWDAKNAVEHRLSVRPRHLGCASELKHNGNFVIGGAMLNEEGQMIGSTMIVQFETEAELQSWLVREPYIVEKVWETYQVFPYRMAQVE